MTYNDEMKVPYVSKELCEYLRETYKLPTVLRNINAECTRDTTVGYLVGVNEVIERLEAIQVQQEEDNGIHR